MSGGGFRASLFHLGSLRRLHEVGLLHKVKTISSVSGGSILSGYLAGLMIRPNRSTEGMQFGDWETEVAAGFRKVAGRDLRTLPVLLHLPWNWAFPGPRVRQVVGRYRDRLTPKMLRELPQRPEFVFCATDMVFGVNWEFRRDKAGDWQAGYAMGASRWSIAQAVAASACFPPLFGPMALDLSPDELKRGAYQAKDRARLCRKLCLSDGGVYDNMALEPVWKSHEVVLVSDCGAPFAFNAARTYVRRLMRYASVVMNQAAATRKRWFFADINERVGAPPPPPKYRGGYWGIAGSVAAYKAPDEPLTGYSQSLVDDVIERVRTDLDRFTIPEMHVLENHGYLLTAAVLRHRRPELLDPSAPAPAPPHPEWMDEGKVRAAMKDSHKRLSLRRLFGRNVRSTASQQREIDHGG
ncbi:MAG: hypothetical protein JWN40_51 [Phycisphaerales bacterium]|nr:hypothetical protein [Phycisphaerales bacterium]